MMTVMVFFLHNLVSPCFENALQPQRKNIRPYILTKTSQIKLSLENTFCKTFTAWNPSHFNGDFNEYVFESIF